MEHTAVQVSFETERESTRRTESSRGGVEGTWPAARTRRETTTGKKSMTDRG